jgi:hypothetical protein
MIMYNTNTKMQQLVRYIGALVYVHSDVDIIAWESIIQGKVQHVLSDLEKGFTWIGERNSRTRL